MVKSCFFLVTLAVIYLILPPLLIAANPLVGDWAAVIRTKGGLGESRTYRSDGTIIVSFGALVDFKYRYSNNTLVLSFPDTDDIENHVQIEGNTMTLTDKAGNKQQLTRMEDQHKSGIIGKWAGDHYTGGKQILHFTKSLNCYLSVPLISEQGIYSVVDDIILESFNQTEKQKIKWEIIANILTVTDKVSGRSKKFRRTE